MTRDRLGSWEPTTVEDRLSRDRIAGGDPPLAMRTTMAIDTHDLYMLVDRSRPDMRVDRDESRRAALRRS